MLPRPTHRRSAGQDLNRDFPDRFSSPPMEPSGSEQPETKAIMDWTLATGFVASASMHEVGPRGSAQSGRSCVQGPCSDGCGSCAGQLPVVKFFRAAGQLDRGWLGSMPGPSIRCPCLLAVFYLQGALVANYPWDGTDDRSTRYEACPDDAVFRHLATLYASTHKHMASPDNAVSGW